MSVTANSETRFTEDSLKKKAGCAPFTEAKRQENWKIMKVTAAEKADIYCK
jgi:hypothetical protein